MLTARLLLAALPLACATAGATPGPTPAPPPTAAAQPAATCKPTGPVLFAIGHAAEPGAKLATSSVQVFTNGAWSRAEVDADGKSAPAVTGCLDAAARKQLETTLQGATWKVVTAQVHCMAMSATFTTYQVNGKPVFTQRLCSGQSLDENSQAKLTAAIALVEPLGVARPR